MSTICGQRCTGLVRRKNVANLYAGRRVKTSPLRMIIAQKLQHSLDYIVYFSLLLDKTLFNFPKQTSN